MKKFIFAVLIAAPIFANQALAREPVSCTFYRQGSVANQGKVYSATDSQSTPDMDLPNIENALAAVVKACVSGEEARSSGKPKACDPQNLAEDLVVRCASGSNEIQFTCKARPVDGQTTSRGVGFTEAHASAIAVKNCLKNNETPSCEIVADSCKETLVNNSGKAKWYNFNSSQLLEPVDSEHDSAPTSFGLGE